MEGFYLLFKKSTLKKPSFFSSVQSLSHVRLFVTPWTTTCQASLSTTNSWSLLKLMSMESMMDAIQPSHPLSSPFPPTFNLFQHQRFFSPISQFFTSSGQSIGISASASVLPMNIQDWFPLGWLIGAPCSPRDSQESSPITQLKNINSSALNFVYSPTLTSINDYWKNHSLD